MEQQCARTYYDDLWSDRWGDMQRLGPVHRHQTERIVSLIEKLHVRTVLDVGCGSGDNLAALRAKLPNLELSGADVSKEALAKANIRVPGAALCEFNVE